MLTQRLAALAVERQAGRIHEHGREIGEEVTPAIEQLLLDDILTQRGARAPSGFSSNSSPIVRRWQT